MIGRAQDEVTSLVENTPGLTSHCDESFKLVAHRVERASSTTACTRKKSCFADTRCSLLFTPVLARVRASTSTMQSQGVQREVRAGATQTVELRRGVCRISTNIFVFARDAGR